MRKHSMLAGALLLLGACASSLVSEVSPPGTVTLGVGEHATIAGTSWTLAFDSVKADSRCPVDAACVWAGEALLALTLSNPLVDPQPGDNPAFTLGGTPVTKYGFRLTTTDVRPLARTTVRIDRRAYKATLRIEVATP